MLLNISRPRHADEPDRAVEERFGGVELYQHAGQSSQIGMDRRGKRRAGIDSIEACRRELDQIGFLDQRLDRRLRRHAPADDLEIDLWRTAPGAGRQGERFDSTN